MADVAGKEAEDDSLVIFEPIDDTGKYVGYSGPKTAHLNAGAEMFQAVKPWVAAVVAPSRVIKPHQSPPTSYLELEWVHGYRGGDVRNNLVYNLRGDMVSFNAGVGVIYSKSAHHQTFYQGHAGMEMSALAIDPRGRFVATGMQAAQS